MKLHEIYSLGGQTMAVADFIEDNIATIETTPEDYPELATKVASRLLKADFQWSWINDAMGIPRGCFNDGDTQVYFAHHPNPTQYRVIITHEKERRGFTLGHFRDHDIIDEINSARDAAPVNEGMGSDVLAFSDYLDTQMRKEVADTRKYLRIANLLFKNGYAWVTRGPEDEPDEGPYFKKGENRVSMSGNKYSRSMTFWKLDGSLWKRWALDSVDKFGMAEIDCTFRGDSLQTLRRKTK
jgi:hypothetical protein